MKKKIVDKMNINMSSLKFLNSYFVESVYSIIFYKVLSMFTLRSRECEN